MRPATLARRPHTAMKAAKLLPERAIQVAFVREWDALGPRDAVLMGTANEAPNSPQSWARFKASGLRPGCPDIVVFWRGGGLGLEFKARGGRVSDAQIAFHEAMEAIGWPVAVVRSVDEAWRVLADAGCPVRPGLLGRVG